MANFECNPSGNVITPRGSSIIFGATADETKTDIATQNEQTYKPYSIVCTEEEEDNLNAVDISFTSSGGLNSTNVQDAINEVELLVYNNTPSFSIETITAAAEVNNFTLTKTFDTSSSLVFYNGLLINNGVHYSFVNKTITLLNFLAEAGDIITVVGLSFNNDILQTNTLILKEE